ncbi:MAG: FkbM family methyltransferase [Acidobacteria bacterium]|nr:FkbM family methyltransferase [Acidobacteriota bacterium]
MEWDLPKVVRLDSPIILDVGANRGQTIDMMCRIFRNPRIIAFEPSKKMFEELENKKFEAEVSCYNMALGAEVGTREFHEYENPLLSSALKLREEGGHPFQNVREIALNRVEISTVDSTISSLGLHRIDLLKIDTQGFDLQVLQGSQKGFERRTIRQVLVELNFAELYEGQAHPMEVHCFIENHGLKLVDMYEKERIGMTLGWCTALYTLSRGESQDA